MTFQANDKALDRLNGAGGRFKMALGQAAEMAGQALVMTSKQGQLSGPKSGVTYGAHKASAPGEYSAVLSGALLNSTDYEANAERIRFGVGVQHGLYQEAGTVHMRPRPNLGNAVDETKPELDRLLGEYTMRIVLGGA